ncbi:MAG: hypothetical protein PF961_10715 [Planctomycetota bacterium]|nr:hypothetical protein [Planctomycetota bacterium]
MAEEFFEGLQADAGLTQAGGEGVAQVVGADHRGDPCLLAAAGHYGGHGPAPGEAAAVGDQPGGCFQAELAPGEVHRMWGCQEAVPPGDDLLKDVARSTTEGDAAFTGFWGPADGGVGDGYALASDTIPLTHQDYYEIDMEPTYGNLSGGPVIDGWAGETNNWSTYGCGQYGTLEDAREAACSEIGTERLDQHDMDRSDANIGPVEAYSALRTDLAYMDAAEWLTEALKT